MEVPQDRPSEIVDAEDAGRRLQLLFRCGGTDGIAEDDLKYYATLLQLLSNEALFAPALQQASKAIWIAYNDSSLVASPNRFTQAICKVGLELGFTGGDLRVLTAAAGPQAFGSLLEGKLLWKDSFALGHGEFAHSYQWLAAGLYLKWGAKTAELYKCTKGRLSIMPGWVKDDDTPGLKLRPIRLWEYLTDCTRWAEKLKPTKPAAREWLADAVLNLCKPKPGIRSTNEWLLKLLTGDVKVRNATKRRLPDMLVMSMEALEAVRKTPKGEAKKALDVFLQEHAPLLSAVEDLLVDQIQICCALTADYKKGGSFRNANNVTELARKNPAWFVCAYETRRIEKLLVSQNAALIDSMVLVLSQRLVFQADTGFPTGRCELVLQSQRGPLTIVIVGATAVDDFLQVLSQFRAKTGFGSTKTTEEIQEAFWTFLKKGTAKADYFTGSQYKTQGSSPVSKSIQGSLARIIHSPMDALAHGRQQHYGSPTKTGQGWTTPVAGTTEKPIDMQGIFSLNLLRLPGQLTTDKEQIEIEFHEVRGKLTKKVFLSSKSL